MVNLKSLNSILILIAPNIRAEKINLFFCEKTGLCMMLNVPKIVYKNELYRDRLRQVYITNALVIEEFDGVKLA